MPDKQPSPKIEIRNGAIYMRHGVKELVVDRTGTPRKVIKATRSGKYSQRTTFQFAYVGDYVAKHQWGSMELTAYSIVVMHENKAILAPINRTELPRVVLEAFDKSGWLVAQAKGDGMLPAGCGWDGKYTKVDKMKYNRYLGLFAGLDTLPAVLELVEVAVRSPKEQLPVIWANAPAIPKQVELTADRVVFCWDAGKVPTIYKLADGVVAVSTLQHGNIETVLQPNEPINITLPQNTTRAIVVDYNAYKNAANVSYGVKWAIYKGY